MWLDEHFFGETKDKVSLPILKWNGDLLETSRARISLSIMPRGHAVHLCILFWWSFSVSIISGYQCHHRDEDQNHLLKIDDWDPNNNQSIAHDSRCLISWLVLNLVLLFESYFFLVQCPFFPQRSCSKTPMFVSTLLLIPICQIVVSWCLILAGWNLILVDQYHSISYCCWFMFTG